MIKIRAEVVRRECDRRMWSIAQLADVAGLNKSTLRVPQSGPFHVRRTTAAKIVKAFVDNPVDEVADELLEAKG